MQFNLISDTWDFSVAITSVAFVYQAENVKTSTPKCDLMCHLRKQKDSPTEREKRTVCKSKCLGDSVQLSVGSAESFPLLITDKQGLIEIHVSQLQLSKSVGTATEAKRFASDFLYVIFCTIIYRFLLTDSYLCFIILLFVLVYYFVINNCHLLPVN